MALFKKKNQPDEKETLVQQQREADLQRCLKVRDEYQANIQNFSENYFMMKILESNDTFSLENYYTTFEENQIVFLPSLPSSYTADFSIRKEIERKGADEYLRFMAKQDFIRVDKSNITLTLTNPSPQAIQEKDFSLLTKTVIEPLKLTMTFLEGSGLEQVGSMPIQIGNQPLTIELLNQHFPYLHLLSCYNIIDVNPADAHEISLMDGSTLLSNHTFSVWRENDLLVLSRFERTYGRSSVMVARLPLEIIEYYREEGDVTYENKITGGGGGGSNYGKAVVGGLLFGAAGAIVASRNEVRDVQSQMVKHDNRVTVMSIFADNQRRRIAFAPGAIDVFHLIIPEKDYDTLALRAQENAAQPAAVSAGGSVQASAAIVEQIQQLAQLKDMGALTETEFTEAKTALLAKLKS